MPENKAAGTEPPSVGESVLPLLWHEGGAVLLSDADPSSVVCHSVEPVMGTGGSRVYSRLRGSRGSRGARGVASRMTT